MPRQDTGLVIRTRKYRQRITKTAAGFSTGENSTPVTPGGRTNLRIQVPLKRHCRPRALISDTSSYARGMTLARWERAVEWPLIFISILFLTAYSVQVLAGGLVAEVAVGIMTITWALFVVDYGVSLWLAPRRWSWFVRHLHDLAIVLLPMLRPLRLLRLVTLVSVLAKVAGNALRGRVMTYVIAASGLLVYLGALAMYDAEQAAPESTIKSLGDAAWWAIVTITTVGYGDMSPTTATGRVIAVALMIGGIALLGVVTATLASWLVDKVSAEDTKTQAVTVEHLELLRDEIAMLRQELGANAPARR